MGRQGHPGIKQLQKAMTTSKAGTEGRECYQSPGGRAADPDVWELELKRRCSHWVTAVPKAEREEECSGVSSLPVLQSFPTDIYWPNLDRINFPAKKLGKVICKKQPPEIHSRVEEEQGLDLKQTINQAAHMDISLGITVNTSTEITPHSMQSVNDQVLFFFLPFLTSLSLSFAISLLILDILKYF